MSGQGKLYLYARGLLHEELPRLSKLLFQHFSARFEIISSCQSKTEDHHQGISRLERATPLAPRERLRQEVAGDWEFGPESAEARLVRCALENDPHI